MAVTVDLLNSTLADLKGPIEYTFEQKSPIHDMLSKKGKVSSDRGTLIERTIMGAAPTTGTGIFGGGETFTFARSEETHKIQLQTHRVVVPISIPKLDLNQNDGKLGAMKLIDIYPAATQKAIPQAFDRFLFTGVSGDAVLSTAAMSGWNTLNGQKTFASGKIGVTNGLLDFVAPASQSDTVQNLAKSTSYNYVNQFSEITGYAADGKRKYKGLIRETARYLPGANAVPDVLFLDFDSYAFVEEDADDHVRITMTGDKMDSAGSAMELTLAGVRVIAAKNIVLTDFTGSAAEGVGYLLSLDGFEWVWFQKPTLSNFTDNVHNQDVVTAKLEMQGALLLRNMRCQGTIVGGARA